jgi:branched-subunit amino acid aminotransferase/4-amino-4-deoxychorismate lyase
MIVEPTSIDGCFETMLYHNGRIWLAEAHFERLGRSLEYLEWPLPDNLTLQSVVDEIISTSNELGFSEVERLRCRLTISKDIGSRNTEWRLDVSVQVHPSPYFKLKSINLDDPVFFGSARRCKLASRDKYFEALNHAKKHGFDDVLLTVEDGYVSESCIANIFWVKEDVFYMPNPNSGQLLGLGIEYFSNVLISNGYTIVTDRFKLESILESETAWIINSARGPIPIECIDNHEMTVISLYSDLIYDLFWRDIP